MCHSSPVGVYKARREKDDPVGVLRRAVRKDCGKVSLAPALAEHLFRQYRDHQHWSYKLHYDNLAALLKADPSLGPLRSYSTVRRYMKAHGLVRRPRAVPKGRPGEARPAQRRQTREIRSYQAEYVGSLWHLDFHHGSLKVLTHRGKWQRPIALGILDDHSRLCCHLQWYLSETAEDLVYGLSQAIHKRGLPRALLVVAGLQGRSLPVRRITPAGCGMTPLDRITDQTAIVPYRGAIRGAGLIQIPRGECQQARGGKTLIRQDESRGSR